MRKIIYRRHGINILYTVENNPTPGTLGSHRLLLEHYRKHEDPPKSRKFEQMLFNLRFLQSMEEKYGRLWCVYCGKKGLRIFLWREWKDRKIMATADHFIPKSIAPDLAKNADNLRVCCDDCNSKKAANCWDEKFPYLKTEENEKIQTQTNESDISSVQQ